MVPASSWALRAALVSALVACAGCLSSGGGGAFGPSFSGGAPGSACDPAQGQSAGCVLTTTGDVARVTCDATSKTWQQLELCTSGTTCNESVDPSDASKKVTACVAPGGGVDSVGAQDAGGGGGDASGGGDGDAGASDIAVDDGSASGDAGGGGDAGPVDVGYDGGGTDAGGVDAYDVYDVDDDVYSDAASDVVSDVYSDVYTDADASGGACNNPTDQNFLSDLYSSANVSNLMTQTVKDCTLTKGCFAKSGDAAQIACINLCIQSAGFVMEYGLSYGCSECFAAWKGHCGAKKCLSSCAVDAGSSACQSCLAQNCDPAYSACIGGMPSGNDAGPSDGWADVYDGGGSDGGGGVTNLCWSSTDKNFISFAFTPNGTDLLTKAVKDCTLTKGCLSNSGDAAQIACINQCLQSQGFVLEYGASSGCTSCFAEWKGHCGAKKCLASCAVDANSTNCKNCLAQNCDPYYYTCIGSGGGGSDGGGSDGGGFDGGASDGGASDGGGSGFGCKGKCGSSSKEADGTTCYCDNLCAEYGDCCSDIKSYCP